MKEYTGNQLVRQNFPYFSETSQVERAWCPSLGRETWTSETET